MTIQNTTGINGFSRLPGAPAPERPPRAPTVATVGGSQEAPIVADGPAVVVPFPVTLQPALGGRPQSLVITTEGPIDTPIVILGP